MDSRSLTVQGFKQALDKYSIPRRGKVLDVGCKNNDLLKEFEDLGFEWFGCDKEASQKFNYKKKPLYLDDYDIPGFYPKKESVIFGDMQNLPYLDSFFNIVFSSHSFEHVENPAQALREFKRVLEPGGWIVIGMPLCNKKYVLEADSDHISVLNPMQLERLARYTSLTFIEAWEEPHPDPLITNQMYLLKKEIA